MSHGYLQKEEDTKGHCVWRWKGERALFEASSLDSVSQSIEGQREMTLLCIIYITFLERALSLFAGMFQVSILYNH